MNASRRNLIEPPLKEAATDLRYLLDRGYPKPAALMLVGNRYRLDRDGRHLIRRAVFSIREAGARRSRLMTFEQLKGARLTVDGFNVLITVESALSGRTIFLADDGVVRDIAGLSSGYRMDEASGGTTLQALSLLMDTLGEARLGYCFVGFQQAMSRSGELAARVRDELSRRGISGRAETLRSVETELVPKGDAVATANSILLDQAAAGFDLAGYVISEKIKRVPEGL